MKIVLYNPVGSGPDANAQEEKMKWIIRMRHAIWESFSNLSRVLNGGLTFGDAVTIDNIAGKWMEYATNGVADTEDTIAHNLGVIPVGVIVMVPPVTGTINRGTTAWTTTAVYLKCSAATQTARIFLVTPPKTTQ